MGFKRSKLHKQVLLLRDLQAIYRSPSIVHDGAATTSKITGVDKITVYVTVKSTPSVTVTSERFAAGQYEYDA